MGINARMQPVDLLGAVEITYNPPSAAANQTSTHTVTIPGLIPGDLVIPFETANETGIAYGNGNIVATADEVDIPVINATAGAIDAASQVFRFLVFRPNGPLPPVVPDV